MEPVDELPKEKNHSTPPPIYNEMLRSIVDWLWVNPGHGDDVAMIMTHEQYSVRASRMKEYKNLTHAHILLLSNYAASDNPRLHKKAHTHLNEIKLLKQKVDFSYKLLRLFKKPTPPYDYYLASILGDAPFWQGVDELIDSYQTEDSMIKSKNDPPPPNGG